FDILFSPTDHAGRKVAMSAQVFCGTVDYHIYAEVRRCLVDGRSEGVISHCPYPALPAQRGYEREIGHVQVGIRWRFYIDELRVRLYCIHKGAIVRLIYVCNLNPILR